MPHSVDRYLKIYLAGTCHDTSWPLEGSQGTTLPRPRGVSSSTRHKTAVSRTSKATIPSFPSIFQGRTVRFREDIHSSYPHHLLIKLIRIMLYQFDSTAFQSQLSTCWFYWIWERTHTSPVDSIGFRTKNSCHVSCIVGAFLLYWVLFVIPEPFQASEKQSLPFHRSFDHRNWSLCKITNALGHFLPYNS